MKKKSKHMHSEQTKNLMRDLCDENQTNEEKLQNHLCFHVTVTSYIVIRHDFSVLKEKIFDKN